MTSENATFWEQFYNTQLQQRAFLPPSQFAAFMAQELPADSGIVDLGCGNGRDTIFFNLLKFDAVGIDAAEQGIAMAKVNSEQMGFVHPSFYCDSICSDRLTAEIARHRNKDLCVYGRFFLHAITQTEQANLFALLANVLSPGHKLAFEYRTFEDEQLLKVAAPHFRRYQSMQQLDDQLGALGFDKIYGVQGQGFAKYQDEDANVARGIYVRVDQ
jgi:SAM-dependent methyltransferase